MGYSIADMVPHAGPTKGVIGRDTNNQSPRSFGARARGAESQTGQTFGGQTGLSDFCAIGGDLGPAGVEAGVVHIANLFDNGVPSQYSLAFPTDPTQPGARALLTRFDLEYGAAVTTAVMDAGDRLIVGSEVFASITQLAVHPDFTNDKVAQYGLAPGEFDLGTSGVNVFNGRFKVEITGSWSVQVNAGILLQFVLEVFTGTWNVVSSFAGQRSIKSLLSPVSIDQETRFLDHNRGSKYRIRLDRDAAPGPQETITATEFVITVSLEPSH